MGRKMPFRCRVAHDAGGSPVLRNGSVLFSYCSRCGTCLIRRGKAWRPLPRGFRLVVGVMSQEVRCAEPPRSAGARATRRERCAGTELERPARRPAFRLVWPGLLGMALQMLAWRLSHAAASWWKRMAAVPPKPARIFLLPPRAHQPGISA